MEQPISRRAWLAALAGGAGSVAAACSSTNGTAVVDTPEGRVLQWQGDDLLVLVSNVHAQYRAGEPIRVSLLVNNQSTGSVQVRLRTRLLGLGDQAVAEAEVASLDVAPEDAGSVEREIPLPRSLQPGDYTLSVEVPPWKRNGRDVGRPGNPRTRVKVLPPE